jgi:O-antigen/teichoic acid export membrane protein
LKLKITNNIFWNSISGIWLALLIIGSTPIYISKLGIEAYGILSIWMVLQVIMNLFDFGLGATLTKSFSDTRNNNDINYKRNLLFTTEIVYFSVNILLLILLLLFSNSFANHWLHYSTISPNRVSYILILIFVTLFFQFPNTLYLNGFTGLQDHRLMNTIQIIGNGCRYGFGIIVILWHADLTYFFYIQIFVAAFQSILSRYLLWKKITSLENIKANFNFALLKSSSRFTFGMAITSFSVVILANADRIMISKLLTTAELGKYAIAYTATGLLQLGIQPFYRTFFPRFSELFIIGDKKSLYNEYYLSCKLIGMIIIPLGIFSYIFSAEIFYIWIGKSDPVIINIFKLLIFAIGCSGLGWLPAAFQQANGWTSLHFKMILFSLFLGIPLMYFTIKHFGIIGATSVWLIHGISEITIGIWLMHKRLLIGELLKWYKQVLKFPILVSFPIVLLSFFLKPDNLNRFQTLIWLVITAFILMSNIFIFGIRKNNLITNVNNE